MDWHPSLIVFCFMCIDVVTGFTQACMNKTLDSTVMRTGLFHKLGFVLSIVLAYLCEYSINYIDLGFTMPLAIPVCAFICATELVSILENLCKITPELCGSSFSKIFNINVDKHQK